MNTCSFLDFRSDFLAAWPSGKAGDCKSFIPSSNLGGVKSGLSCKSFIFCRYYVRRKLLDGTIISLPYFFPSTSAMTNAPPS